MVNVSEDPHNFCVYNKRNTYIDCSPVRVNQTHGKLCVHFWTISANLLYESFVRFSKSDHTARFKIRSFFEYTVICLVCFFLLVANDVLFYLKLFMH